jgi:hypothetical protein
VLAEELLVVVEVREGSRGDVEGPGGGECSDDPEPVRQKEERFVLAFREAHKQGFTDSDSPATPIVM